MSNFDICSGSDIGFLPGEVLSKFKLGDTVKLEDAAWEMGIRDTFSLINKQSFVVGFGQIKRSDYIFLNFITPNVFENKKFFPERIPINTEFIYKSKTLLIEQITKK